MKKIMIALAVVAMAACSQASVVKWGTGSSAVKFNGTALGGQSVSLYMVGVNGADDVLVDTRSTLANPPVNKGKLTSDVGSGQSAYDYNSVIAGGALINDAGTDAGRQYYIVINYNDGTKDYTYTSSAVASSGLSATALGSVSFTVNDTISEVAGTKNAWVAAAVPEPTSGLLMLVGLGALALRRRRA